MTSRQKAREKAQREEREAKERENDGREWTTDAKVDSLVLRKVFQLHVPACRSVAAKNCVLNPNCLHGLGNGKEGLWLDDPPHFAVVPTCLDALKSDPTAFAGLRNLGATCYLNSLLQCLFMNLPFRQAIFDYQGKPNNIMQQLQEIFVALQCTKRAHVDPTQLVTALQIPQTHQQDVQEFNHLLLNKVGSLLRTENADLVGDMFNGELGYSTTCEKCAQTSVRKSSFCDLSLQIQGRDSIISSLQDHFLPEKFDGANQYFCTGCNCKQNALRETYLDAHPQVLQLHLMRFEFDPETHSKKKLSDNIFIPFQLDLNQVQKSQKKNATYRLTAILRHRGVSAHFGHYLADVLDQSTEVWWRFNDTQVLKTGTLGEDDDKTEPGKPKKGQKRKQAVVENEPVVNGQRSRNAYMLIYTRAALPLNIPVQIPASLEETKARVEAEDAQVAARVAELTLAKELIQKLIDKRKQEAENMMDLAPVPPLDTTGRLVSVEWLKRWLIGESELYGFGLPPDPSRDVPSQQEIEAMFDAGDLLPTTLRAIACPHQGVDPKAVSKFKLIADVAWKVLVESCGRMQDAETVQGIPESRLCEECARGMMQEKIDGKLRAEDQKALYENLLENPNVKEGYLVCKQWHRIWAAQQKKSTATTSLYESVSPVKAPKTPLWDNINERLLCKHGKLDPNAASASKIVSEEAWQRLLQSHPKSTAFATEEPQCTVCAQDQEEANAKEHLQDDERKAIRKGASRTGKDTNDFPDASKPPVAGEFNLVTAHWQCKFRTFMEEGGEPPPPLEVRCLRCPHGKLLYEPLPVAMYPHGTDKGVLYLMEAKSFKFLAEKFGVDGDPIPVTVLRSGLDTWDSVRLGVDSCSECIRDRILSETQSRLSYENGGSLKIVVVKPTANIATYFQPQGGRRSRRDGEPHELKISSTATVRNLKMRIVQEVLDELSEFEMYSQGKPLNVLDISLAQANVQNGSTVLVQAREGILDLGIAVAPTPERGFVGTALMVED